MNKYKELSIKNLKGWKFSNNGWYFSVISGT